MDANYKISRSSLHVEVTDRLREMIYERSLPPGERIDELGLSARLGTSRTPLREALKVLAHEGLVRLVPGRGAFVVELSASEAESLFPVLGLLQSRCAAEAVRRQLAVQGQQVSSASHAIVSRTARAGRADVDAAFEAGRLVRSWPMRGTIHITTAADHHWLRVALMHRMDAWARRTEKWLVA